MKEKKESGKWFTWGYKTWLLYKYSHSSTVEWYSVPSESTTFCGAPALVGHCVALYRLVEAIAVTARNPSKFLSWSDFQQPLPVFKTRSYWWDGGCGGFTCVGTHAHMIAWHVTECFFFLHFPGRTTLISCPVRQASSFTWHLLGYSFPSLAHILFLFAKVQFLLLKHCKR